MKNTSLFEPAFEKVKELVEAGHKNALEYGLSFYGTEDDLLNLKFNIEKIWNRSKDNLIIVDFTPMPSMGRKSKLHILEELYQQVPYIICANKGIVLEQIKLLKNLSVIVLDDSGCIESIVLGEPWKDLIRAALGKLKIVSGKSFRVVREKFVDNKLMEILKDGIKNPPEKTRQTTKIPLPDGAWANKWIDVKKILTDTSTAFFIAYQMGYLLTDGYNKELHEDGFVASNNTAYVIGSYISLIFESKKLIIIDRIGPYPSLNRSKLLSLKNMLENKRLCMIEDVISTGREVDLTQLLLMMNDSEISRVISLFNLQIAAPRLVDKQNILSLCTPSDRISYKREPMFKKN